MEKKIYYHDTDAGGVVYYANYLKYLEEARTEFLESKGLDLALLRDRAFFYAVNKCSIVYRAPARYGDTIKVDTLLKEVTAVRMLFDQKVYDQKTQKLLVEAEVSLVCLDKNFKPTPIPEDLKEKMLAS